VGIFDRDYMRFPQGWDDTYFAWLRDARLSSRVGPGDRREPPPDAGESSFAFVLVCLLLSVAVGLGIAFMAHAAGVV
jgi:hypothetical protein